MHHRRFFLFIPLLLALLVLTRQPAQAHAVPIGSTPAPNAVLDEGPQFVQIRFNEPVVAELSRIEVLTQAGQPLETGPLTVSDDVGATLRVTMPAVNNGTYLVSWQVLSAVDGHTTSGTFSFGVGVTALATVDAGGTVAAISPLSAAARWLRATALALLVGLFAFPLLVWQPAGGPRVSSYARPARRLGWIGLGLLGAALLLTLLDQGGKFDFFAGGNLITWLGTRFGLMWSARLGLGLLLGLLLWRSRGLPAGGVAAAGLLGSLLLGGAIAAISHSAALPAEALQATLVDLGHLLAAGLWVGGLLQLLPAVVAARSLPDRPELPARLVVQFSLIAALAVGLLLASGFYLTAIHVGSWTALLGTTYGLLLLAKLVLLLPVLLLAAVNLLWIKPRLRAGETPRRLPALLAAESAITLLILLTAGLLTDAQRGADAPLLADDPGRTVVTAAEDDLTMSLAIEPALVGANSFDIYLLDGENRPVAELDEVDVRFTYLEQSIGAAEAVAQPLGDGLYRVEGSFISLIGGWQVEVAVRRPGVFDTFLPVRLDAGLGGTIRPATAEAGLRDRLATLTTLLNGAITGIGLILLGLGWVFVSWKAAHRRWQLVPLLALSVLAVSVGIRQTNEFFGREFTPLKFTTNPILPDSDSIAVGQALFQEECVICHGPQGYGDGPGAVGLNPAPANFTDGHTAIHSDGDLYYWIRNGIAGSAMPAFADTYSEEETWHLVNYVRRLSQQ